MVFSLTPLSVLFLPGRCSYRWRKAVGAEVSPVMCISSQVRIQGCHVGSLVWAIVEVFAPQKWASATKWDCSFCPGEPVVQHLLLEADTLKHIKRR